MPTKKIEEYLQSQNIPYEIMAHPTAYTAQETAAMAHVTGWKVAKNVIVSLDGRPAMVVIAAPLYVDIDRLADEYGAGEARLASEEEIIALFPDSETGAEPPFGRLYGMEVLMDAGAAAEEVLLFDAGTHHELIKMSGADFRRLEQPKIVHCAIWSPTESGAEHLHGRAF